MRFEPVAGWGALPEGWRYAGKLQTPPREVRCLQKFRRVEA